MNAQAPLPLLLRLSPERLPIDLSQRLNYRYNVHRQLNVDIMTDEPAVNLTSIGTKTQTKAAEPTDDDAQMSFTQLLGTETFTKSGFEDPDSDADVMSFFGTRTGTYAGAEPPDSD